MPAHDVADPEFDPRRRANFENWEDRVPVHTGPDGYGLAEFDDPTHISRVVQFDREHLGDLRGLDVVHLQCHIGTDTVSLDRLGAGSVTGYDFSPAALTAARELAARAGSTATFVEGELYDAAGRLGAHEFDLVFTGIGALIWLPDIDGWARVVAQLLRPGGRLYLRDGHPMLLAMDDARPDGVVAVEFPRFGAAGPTRFDEATSYEGDGTELAHCVTYQWNWGLGEIVTALLRAGFTINALTEHHTVPWNALDGQMEPVPPFGEFQLVDRPERLACTYTIQASIPG